MYNELNIDETTYKINGLQEGMYQKRLALESSNLANPDSEKQLCCMLK